MGLKALEISQFERQLIARIVAEATDQGVSRRALGSRAGLSVGRALRILAGEASCSMTAFEALCDALGLEMWRVVQEVETGASAPGGSLAVVPGYGADVGAVTGDAYEVPYAALDTGTDPDDEAVQMMEAP